MRHHLLALALTGFVASPAAADLSTVPEVNERLITIAMGDALRKTCPDVEARLFAALAYIRATNDVALRHGYSQAEADAYVDDRGTKDRLRGIARDRLAAMGAAPGDAAGHCAVAKAEIARGSELGQLLKG